MPKFIKLTTLQGDTRYINFNLVQAMIAYEDEDETEIQFADGCVFVKETPQQILELIQATK